MLGIYITAGYPNPETTIEALRILDEAGVDLIELGVPFSDPLADGPVIQAASHRALKQGINLDQIFDLVTEARSTGIQSPENKGLNNVILFSYYNPLYVYGFDKLIDKCKEYQISGVLIPDLPVDEAEELSKKFQAADLDLVLLAAITSSEARLEKIAQYSNPWIYLVSRIGITGSDQDITKMKTTDSNDSQSLEETIAKIKKLSSKPLALGFGIDSRDKVEQAYKLGADMAIIGSKAVTLSGEQSLDNFREFISSLTCLRQN